MLYHADIRLPDGFSLPAQRVALRYTRHAEHACKTDRYGVIPQFDTIPLQVFQPVEVEVEGKRVTKIVVRGHFDSTRDVVFALIPGREWTVKTCWYNKRDDTHKTLDESRYVK